MRFVVSLFIFIFLYQTQSTAQSRQIDTSNIPKATSRSVYSQSIRWNQMRSQQFGQALRRRGVLDAKKVSPVSRPYAEYQRAGYLLFSLEDQYDSYQIKQIMARYLPYDMKLAVFRVSRTGQQMSDIERIKIRTYKKLVGENRFLFLNLKKDVKKGNTSFWSRDFLPVPVYLKGYGPSNYLGFTDAAYYHATDTGNTMATLFGGRMLKHDFKFEGGNFQADHMGNCFLVNYSTGSTITEEVLKYYYGCQKVFKLPFKGGIGHLDERVRIVNERLVFTDTPEYAPVFEKLGYKVEILPKADGRHQTYVNSLYLNGTLFFPTFQNAAKNNLAYSIYKKHISRVIPINSTRLSQGQGSLHCITMVYPRVNHRRLLRVLNYTPQPY